MSLMYFFHLLWIIEISQMDWKMSLNSKTRQATRMSLDIRQNLKHAIRQVYFFQICFSFIDWDLRYCPRLKIEWYLEKRPNKTTKSTSEESNFKDIKKTHKTTFVSILFHRYFLLLQFYQRQITLRIVGHHFSSRRTATLNICLIYLKLLVHVF